MEDTLYNRTFRDSDGNIVIAQMQNLSILVWFAALGAIATITVVLFIVGLDTVTGGGRSRTSG
jgi:hypothetical protein